MGVRVARKGELVSVLGIVMGLFLLVCACASGQDEGDVGSDEQTLMSKEFPLTTKQDFLLRSALRVEPSDRVGVRIRI